jgi:uncharacterized membrane protein
MLGTLLRVGVTLAAIVVLAGGTVFLIHHGTDAPHYGVFQGQPSELRALSGIVADALAMHSPGLIQLGLLLLIATPVARVVFSLFAFLREGDLTYVVVTAFVLAVLVYSLS